MSNFQVQNLWPIPLYRSNFKVQSHWKKFTENLNYERTNLDNASITTDKKILEKLPDLKKEIQSHVNRFVFDVLKISDNVDFYMTTSWSNISSPNEDCQLHYHSNSLISGFYYTHIPKKSGDFYIEKSVNNNNLFGNMFRFNHSEYNNINAYSFQIEVNEGDILLFPGHLYHSVTKNLSNKDRYSIAFNFFCKGEYNDDINKVKTRG